MKVSALISKLQHIDQDLDVLCYTDHATMLPEGHMFRLFDVQFADVVEGERTTPEDGIPSMTFGQSDSARKVVFLHITPDF